MRKRRKRRAIAANEKQRVAVAKSTITTPALEDGGKLAPALMPGGGLLDDEKKKRPPLRVVSNPTTKTYPDEGVNVANLEEVAKIFDGQLATLRKARRFEIADRSVLLLHKQKAHGVLTLGGVKVEGDGSYSWEIKDATIFDRPKDTNVEKGVTHAGNVSILEKQKATVSHDPISKIRDVKTYDPSKVSDAVLRDDFRIVLAWHVGKTKHSEAILEDLLRKILREAVKRGPKVIRFDPKGMAPSVRPFFERVARSVKVPAAMFKGIALAPDSDPSDMTTAELLKAHDILHGMYRIEALTQLGVKGWSLEDVVNLHALIVDELEDRDKKHPPPPSDELDSVSGEFEASEVKKADLDTAEVEVEKARLALWGSTAGKTRIASKIVAKIPAHKTYVEPFAGGAAVFYAKPKSDVEVLADANPEVAHAFRFIRDLTAEQIKAVKAKDWKVTREQAKRVHELSPKSGVDRFYRFAFKRYALFMCNENRITAIDPSKEGKIASIPDRLEATRDRLKGVKVEDSFEAAVKKYDSPETFYYLDPPYADLKQEVGEKSFDEAAFIKTLQGLKGKFLLHYDGNAAAKFKGKGWRVKVITVNATPGHTAGGVKVGKLVEVDNFAKRPVKKSEPVAAALKEAKRAQEKDGLTLGEFFYQPKATRFEITKIEDFLELYEEDPKSFPLFVQKQHAGIRHQIHRDGDKVAIVDMTGANKAEGFPEIVKAVLALKSKELVLDCEIERWKGRKLLPRDSTEGKAIANVFDVLHTKADGDIHKWPTVQRLRKLAALGIQQSTMAAPGLGSRLNAAPAVVADDLVSLERAIRMVRKLPGSKGVVVKQGDAGYSLAPETPDSWIALSNGKPTKSETTKEADPFMEIPAESKSYRYTVQHHWRGKGLHTDLRIGFRPGKLLLGWTLNTQIAGVVKDPVDTLAKAKAWVPRFDELSKIDWRSGKWAERSKRGATQSTRVEILSEKKAPEPWAWMDVEGKTKDPEPGKAPPPGGTRNHPGVYHIVDQGSIEFGAQKPWFHEYFVHGDAMSYRIFFRQLKLGAITKARHSYSTCMECKTAAPTIDVLWADGRGRAWFCKACYPKWLKKVGGKTAAEVIGTKAILGGNAPPKFSDVHKRAEEGVTAELHPLVEKVTLPPSEGSDERPLGGRQWLAIRPDDQTPYVISPDAVKKGWVPPLGVSALPKVVRSQIPERFRYWEADSVAKARATRDELVKAASKGEVKIDVGTNTRKASKQEAEFVLQQQAPKGAKAFWDLRIDIGRPKVLVLKLNANPLDGGEVTATIDEGRKASMAVEGPIKPGHYLNPTKSTPSAIEVLDKGKAKVLSLSKDFIRVQIEGRKLKGLFEVTRDNAEKWLMAPTKAAPEVNAEPDGAEVEKRAQELADASWFVPIQKVDKEKRLVTGVVLEPGEVDAQNDTISAEVIEKASIRFLARFNDKTQLGLMHKKFGDVGLELAHSWIALEPGKIGGKKVKKGSWLMTMRVVSDKLWQQVKKGGLAGFSVGGVATVAG